MATCMVHCVQPVTKQQSALSAVFVTLRAQVLTVFLRQAHFHRFTPMCFPVLPWFLAVLPVLHCADCFFLGAGTLALPLKAFAGSSLLIWVSPEESAKLISLLKVRGWYSDAHCCRDDMSKTKLLRGVQTRNTGMFCFQCMKVIKFKELCKFLFSDNEQKHPAIILLASKNKD